MWWPANIAPTARSSMPDPFVPLTRSVSQRPMSPEASRRLNGHDRDADHGRADLQRRSRAPPARVARALLPDARQLRGGRGRPAGGVDAGVEAARDLRR